MKLNIYVLITIMVFVSACQKEEIPVKKEYIPDSQLIGFSDFPEEGLLILGKQLKNPYSLEVMKRSKDSLMILGNDSLKYLNVRLTHYYVKFKPKNEDQRRMLKRDTSVIYSEVPLLYEIKKGGTYYKDPTLPDSTPNPLYTSVSVAHSFPPGIDYDIIDEQYFPEEMEDEILSNVIDELVNGALHLTNNFTEPLGISFKRPSKWRPSGRIRAWDDLVGGLVPVYKAKIRTTRYTKQRETYTDLNGYYTISTQYRRKVRYRLIWETNDYDLRVRSIFQARYTGPWKKESWNLDVQSHFGETKGLSAIHRASARYFYRNIEDLTRPTSGGPKYKVAYDHEETEGPLGVNNGHNEPTGVFNSIRIKGKNKNGTQRKVSQILSTTIHEWGHTTHRQIAGVIRYFLVNNVITESWARAIQAFIVPLEYNDLGVFNTGNYKDPTFRSYVDNQAYNKETYVTDPVLKPYSPLFIDLVDNFNQFVDKGYGGCSFGYKDDFKYISNTFRDCFIAEVPTGEEGFIYLDNLYYTPVNCCDCPVPGSFYDGANCKVLDVPDNCIAQLVKKPGLIDKLYITPEMDISADDYTDEISGYSPGFIEKEIIAIVDETNEKNAINRVRSILLDLDKPYGVSRKGIDLYFESFLDRR
ncbi:hypothetical protein [Luteibaculum oceani]|uniref:Uncharacterized protein n=1 Tax=Luteibaculum oceani TaxID=1294296 RepID=A0A5C6USL0_9FLAO|nr:hypothetical protein [Luteibaculum oceani]TXC75246.1 hypothetical protein FRX97_12045 [Luteibaculum oceani]